MAAPSMDPTHEAVKKYYGAIAQRSGSCCGEPYGSHSSGSCCSGSSNAPESSSCCCGSASKAEPVNPIYSAEVINGIPDDIALSTNGSGDPVTLAQLKQGERVLDLGSGTGLDAILAARKVGPMGSVIGVDMTPEMLDRARANIDRLGMENVEFREGLLEALPVDDNSVDVVISNCVINLSPDKQLVLREVFRVLKPGGRIAVSDTVSNHPITDELRKNQEHWCSCTSGALTVHEYMDKLNKAGFKNISLEPDVDMIRKTIESQNAMHQSDAEIEQVLRDIAHLDTIKELIIAPYKITASKPN